MTTSTTRSPLPLLKAMWTNLGTGLIVLGKETCWLASGLVNDFEVWQLRRRISREEAALGRLLMAASGAPQESSAQDSAEAQSIRERILFLHDEVKRFANLRLLARERHVARLRARCEAGSTNDTVKL